MAEEARQVVGCSHDTASPCVFARQVPVLYWPKLFEGRVSPEGKPARNGRGNGYGYGGGGYGDGFGYGHGYGDGNGYGHGYGGYGETE